MTFNKQQQQSGEKSKPTLIMFQLRSAFSNLCVRDYNLKKIVYHSTVWVIDTGGGVKTYNILVDCLFFHLLIIQYHRLVITELPNQYQFIYSVQ